MGVQGFWQLIDSVGRPVTLESLEGKVLAIDVSIWLNQALKGYRDGDGKGVSNAHLMLLVTRICKLLFYRIKPIFVFDGAAPILKKQTLAARQERKEDASQKSGKTRQKILTNFLKNKAIGAALGRDSEAGISTNTLQSPTDASISSNTSQISRDIFDLPPIPEKQLDEVQTEMDRDLWEDRLSYQQTVSSIYHDVSEVDPDSEDFQSLPAEIQHEILSDMKEAEKTTSWARLDEMPEDSVNFSDFQVKRLLKKSKLSQKIENVRKVMNTQASSDLVSEAAGGLTATTSQLQSQRVLSEDASHYLLIKKVNSQSPMDAIAGEVVSPYFRDSKRQEVLTLSGIKKDRTECQHISEPEGLIQHKVTDNTDQWRNGECVQNNYKQSNATVKQVVADCDSVYATLLKGQSSSGGNNSFLEGGFIIENEAEVETGVSRNERCLLESVVRVENSEEYGVGKAKKERGPAACWEGGVTKDIGAVVDKEQIGTCAAELCHDTTEDVRVKNIDFRAVEVLSTDSRTGEVQNMDLTAAEVHGTDSDVEVVNGEYGPLRGDDTNVVAEEDVTVVTKVVLSESEEEESVITEGVCDQHFDKVATVLSQHGDIGSGRDIHSDLLEVTIEPSNIQQDELFPASIFEASNDIQPSVHSPSQSTAQSTMVQSSSEEGDTRCDISERPALSEFIGLSQSDLEALSVEIGAERRTLQQERGRLERMAMTITDQMYADSQELLKLFGIPFVVSPSEAEAQCAQLDLAGLTDGSITDDSDIWLFGGRNVYRSFFNKDKRVKYYRLSDIEQHFGLDRRRFISVALVSGCDYTEGIFNAGPVTAMEILSEFSHPDGLQSIKLFREWWDECQKQLKIPQETKIKSKLRQLDLREGFPNPAVVEAFLNPSVDESNDAFSWGQPDLQLIRDFASEKLGWTQKKTDEVLLPVMKKLNDWQPQKKITNFFSSHPLDLESTQPKKISSKRVQRVVNKFTHKESELSQNEVKRQEAAALLKRSKVKLEPRRSREIQKKMQENFDFSDDDDLDYECLKACEAVETKVVGGGKKSRPSGGAVGWETGVKSNVGISRGKGGSKRTRGGRGKSVDGKKSKQVVKSVRVEVKLSESSSGDSD